MQNVDIMKKTLATIKVSLLVLSTCFVNIHSEATCDFKVVNIRLSPLFSQDAVPLPTIGRQIIVQSSGTCSVHADDILKHFTFPKEITSVAFIKFECALGTTIRFNKDPETSRYENVIGYLQALKCSIDPTNGGLYTFLKLTNNRVFALLDNDYDIISDWSNVSLSCNAGLFEKTVSLIISKVPQDINTLIEQMFPCSNSIKEIILTDCYGIVNQTLLEETFPHLQTLEIKDCELSGVINFPWDPFEATLPNNLSRSDYLQEHYSRALGLKIPPHYFRRQFSLTNTTSNESQIVVDGRLDYLKLSHNPILTIDEELLKRTHNLQVLKLSQNMIKIVNERAFDSLSVLIVLDMSKNDISYLYPGTFSKLKSLLVLDLSHNKLKKLSGELLFSLNNLLELNLDHNDIVSISEDALPTDSLKFHSLTVNFNPLRDFPLAVFYIRSLRTVKLHHTHISFGNMSELLQQIDKNDLVKSVSPSQSSFTEDILETTKDWRIIDLTGSDVTGFILEGNMTSCMRKIMLLILKHFKFVLKDNPLSCFDDIITFNGLLDYYIQKGYFTGKEYFFDDWLCKYPIEFENKNVLKIQENDTYGKIQDRNCPSTCTCFRRNRIGVNIIDCRYTDATSLPEIVPNGVLDVWLSHNNISLIDVQSYFKRVRQLDLSVNTISFIHRNVFDELKQLQVLKLDNNLLTNIPENINLMKFALLTLKNNPFVCDCKMLWFKRWSKRRQSFKNDFDDIDCFTEGKQLSFRLLAIPDGQFTCKHPNGHSNYTLTIAGTGISVFVVLLVILIVFLFKQEIKITIFTNFHWHPFDRGKSEAHEHIDLTVIHEVDSKELVEQRLIKPLNGRFTVTTMGSDFVPGYTIQENIRSAIYHSKHILLVISDKMVLNKNLLEYTWGECQYKIKMTRMNFLLITRTETCGTISPLSRDVRRYLKHHPHLNSKRSMCLKEIRYILSSYSNPTATWTSSRETETAQIQSDISRKRQFLLPQLKDTVLNGYRHNIFCCYGFDDKSFSQDELIPQLEKLEYNVITPDGDFHPGECILNSIGEAVENCSHTLFITSNLSSIEDIQALVFQRALEKTRLDSYNHLIVIFLSDTAFMTDYKEMNDYLNSFVCLDARHSDFFPRLKMALSPRGSIDTNEIPIQLDSNSIT